MDSNATERAAQWVGIEGIGSFPAVRLGPRWNGWEAPTFTAEVAARIAEGFNAADDEGHATLREDGAWVFAHDQWEEPDVYEPNADGTYDIGSWAWTWSPADIRDFLDPHGLAVRTREDGSIVAASSEADAWMVGVYASEDTYEDGDYSTLTDYTDPREAARAYLAEVTA